MSTVVIIGYVPSPSFGFPASFLKNIFRFKTAFDLVLYSFHPWAGAIQLKENPDSIKARLGNGDIGRRAVNNCVWLNGLGLAQERGADYIIYLESDCRVGCDYWDSIMMEEAMCESINGGDFICAGSMVWFNPCNHSREVTRMWHKSVSRSSKSYLPVMTYGASGCAERFDPVCFVNGALGIYNMRYMERFFNINGQSPESIPLYDYHIGVQTWMQYGAAGFNKVIHLSSMFSSMGDVLTDEQERRRMILGAADGQKRPIVAVHQIKSDWDGNNS